MKCPKCNNQIPEDSRYCPDCGHKIDGVASSSLLFCPGCGSINIDDTGDGFHFKCNDCQLLWDDAEGVVCPKCGSNDMYVAADPYIHFICKKCGYRVEAVGEYLHDKDNVGDYMGAYFNVDGIILGESTEQAIRAMGGLMINSKDVVYLMPSYGLKCYFFGESEVDLIQLSRNEPIPVFYASIGVSWNMTKREFKIIFENRGFAVKEDADLNVALEATKFCNQYQKTISIFGGFSTDGMMMEGFFIGIG